jgi:hypothetical protein
MLLYEVPGGRRYDIAIDIHAPTEDQLMMRTIAMSKEIEELTGSQSLHEIISGS